MRLLVRRQDLMLGLAWVPLAPPVPRSVEIGSLGGVGRDDGSKAGLLASTGRASGTPRFSLEDALVACRATADQNLPMVSPPARVLNACHVGKSTLCETNRVEASLIATLQPPEWPLPIAVIRRSSYAAFTATPGGWR